MDGTREPAFSSEFMRENPDDWAMLPEETRKNLEARQSRYEAVHTHLEGMASEQRLFHLFSMEIDRVDTRLNARMDRTEDRQANAIQKVVSSIELLRTQQQDSCASHRKELEEKIDKKSRPWVVSDKVACSLLIALFLGVGAIGAWAIHGSAGVESFFNEVSQFIPFIKGPGQ